MKKMISSFPMLVLVSMICFVGCVSTRNNQDATEFLFQSEEGNLSVINNTNTDMVLLVGNINRKILLGGIRAMSERTFDIKKIPELTHDGVFIVRGITYDDYKNNLIMQDNVVYTGMVFFDLRDESYKSNLIISDVIDTKKEFYVHVENNNLVPIQLRKDHPKGEIVAVLPPLCRNPRLYILPVELGYSIFSTVEDKSGQIFVIGNIRIRHPDPSMNIRFNNFSELEEKVVNYYKSMLLFE